MLSITVSQLNNTEYCETQNNATKHNGLNGNLQYKLKPSSTQYNETLKSILSCNTQHNKTQYNGLECNIQYK